MLRYHPISLNILNIYGFCYYRYNEIVNKQPFVLSHDILKKIKPKDDEQKVLRKLFLKLLIITSILERNYHIYQ